MLFELLISYFQAGTMQKHSYGTDMSLETLLWWNSAYLFNFSTLYDFNREKFTIS